MSGLELQIELAKVGIEIPIIFITGHGDIPMAVRAMRNGAVEFLTKPLRDQDILEAVQSALELDCSGREAASAISVLRRNYDSLTAREHRPDQPKRQQRVALAQELAPKSSDVARQPPALSRATRQPKLNDLLGNFR